MKKIIFAIAFLALKTLLTAQGPLDGYLKGKGNLDIAASFSSNSARRFDGAPGQTFDEGYRGSLLGLFAEYGLAENFDLVGTAAYVFTFNQNGFQDGGLFAKYRPWHGNLGRAGRLHVLSGIGASFPLSDYRPTATGALGTKAVAVPLRAILQWETPTGFFVNLTGGYNFRLDELKEPDIALIRKQRPDYQPDKPAHYATFLGKIGFPSAHYYLDAWVEIQKTTGGSDYVPNLPDLPQAYGVSYLQFGGTAYYSENERHGFYLSGGYISGGRNVSRILRLTGGVVLKL